jgi:endoglucanase
MKKNIIITTIALLTTIHLNAQNFVKQQGQLSVNGIQLVDKNNQPVVLRGVSLGWSNFWPRFYSKDAVKWLKNDWDITVIRAAMGVDLGKDSYLSNPENSVKLVENVVEGAIRQGIYVIIDWHCHNIHTEDAAKFFDEMSKKYARYPNIIYELFNEPNYESWTDVKKYSETVIQAIRKNDTNNVILVGSPHWDQDINLPADDPITGQKNIMYTLHYYANTHFQWLRDRADKAMEKGIPIFISESAGMEASGNGAMNYEEWQKWIDWSEAHKISWVTWSISDKKETCSMLLPTAPSEGKWNDSDLQESGKKTREYLREMNTTIIH